MNKIKIAGTILAALSALLAVARGILDFIKAVDKLHQGESA